MLSSTYIKKIVTQQQPVLHDFLHETQVRVEHLLKKRLSSDIEIVDLHAAMEYSLLSGGKRIRPALVYAVGELFAADNELLDRIACAVEMIHTFSLIHDDLPAMDNDVLRRGKPTCHIQFNEATAILAGNALQSLAFECLTNMDAAVISTLAQATGVRGMASGQAMDLYYTNKTIDLPTLVKLHDYKTGALIKACVHMAALVSKNVSAVELQQLATYAEKLGLAFQVYDDILDTESDTVTLGKTAGKDELNNKATFVTALGLSEAKEFVLQLYLQAIDALKAFNQQADNLRALAAFAIQRNY